MKIFVKTLKGTSFDVEVKPEDAVFDLKKKIETAKGWDVYPAAQQMLVYQGKILNDNNTTLQENNVSESSFVVIMLNKNNKKPSGPGNSEDSTSTANSTAPATTTVAPQTRPPADDAVNNLEGEILLIQQILDMGGGTWDRDTVVRALRAAHNNPDTAVDFLYSGIPEAQQADQISPVARAPGRQPPQPTQPIPIPSPSSGPNANPLDLFPRRLPGNMESASGAAASVGTSTSRLDFLRNIPQFQVLRAMVQAHPQLLEPMLRRLARQLNPQQARLIQENQADFLGLINESIQGDSVEGNNIGQQLGGGGAMPQPQPQPQPQEIRVTAEEHEAIGRLVAMGFDRALVLEVYFACNKNEQLAANYLLDHMHDFDH